MWNPSEEFREYEKKHSDLKWIYERMQGFYHENKDRKNVDYPRQVMLNFFVKKGVDYFLRFCKKDFDDGNLNDSNYPKDFADFFVSTMAKTDKTNFFTIRSCAYGNPYDEKECCPIKLPIKYLKGTGGKATKKVFLGSETRGIESGENHDRFLWNIKFTDGYKMPRFFITNKEKKFENYSDLKILTTDYSPHSPRGKKEYPLCGGVRFNDTCSRFACWQVVPFFQDHSKLIFLILEASTSVTPILDVPSKRRVSDNDREVKLNANKFDFSNLKKSNIWLVVPA
ncbi:hypothetical protein [uncultured Enterococcus sp.]|uniref:hypothetical protein n=1 Tax=uncultured Enterococcus sp. TaxID=167972 RepID=UPI002AA8E35A|nr:hypothetical protein [uncultured Enterococcus sp.]